MITFLNEPNLILLHTVKWFQVLLCITNNSIKHESSLSLLLLLFLHKFFTPVVTGNSPWGPSDKKSPQLCRVLLVDLSSAVVWIVSILPQISSSLSLIKVLGIVLIAPIMSISTDTFIFHNFFRSSNLKNFFFLFFLLKSSFL